MSGAACALCSLPLDPNSPDVWRRVRGWERRAPRASSRRGGSDIVLRELEPEWACADCVRRLQRGVAVRQEALL